MHSVLLTASPQAHMIATLAWWMFGVAAVVWLAVVCATLLAGRRRRRRRREQGSDGLVRVEEATDRRLERVVAVSVFATILVLAGFLAFDFAVGRALAQHPNVALTIEVTGRQWWWSARYEDPAPHRIVETANEIHVPVGQPIQLKLRAADVIHSLWVPSLNGKRDLIPGYTTTLWFRADTAGVYRGQCAEFCGLQHAAMGLYIIAEPPVQFAAWLAAASTPTAPPTDPVLVRGQRIFMRQCAVCHSISGTEARGTVGPGLSHFKSRSSIAAGTLSNTRENLTRWIRNPAAYKPGVRMPAVAIDDTELAALVAYLETLK
jgi:cytochrome c oxidase subunit 2